MVKEPHFFEVTPMLFQTAAPIGTTFLFLLGAVSMVVAGCGSSATDRGTSSRLRCEDDSECTSGSCVAGYCEPAGSGADSGTASTDAGSSTQTDAGSVGSSDAGDPAQRDAGGGQVDAGSGKALFWFTTCGDPVCGLPQGPSTLPACSRDLEGQSCSNPGEQCALNDGCGTNLVCAKADPKLGPGGCPISRRRYKTDIDYLSDTEVDRAHDELMSIPLATYRYRVGDSREHLGFIMEEVEPSLSVDSRRGVVDLYGYTSLAVAALQAQNRRVDALEREVAALRAAQGTLCQ